MKNYDTHNLETSDVYEHYLLNNILHRTDGPAIIYENNISSWYINGIEYSSLQEFQKAANLSDEDKSILELKYGHYSFM